MTGVAGSGSYGKRGGGDVSRARIEDLLGNAIGLFNTPLMVAPANTARTAFGYARVAVPNIELSGTFTEDERAIEFETDTDGGGDSSAVHDATTAAWTLTAGDTAADFAMLSSRRYIPYFSGHSQRSDITGAFGAPVAGITKRMGYFDDNDGVYFEQQGDGSYHLTIRTSTSGSPVDTNSVERSAWDDPMDGTGLSRENLTDAQLRGRIIFSSDLQWLGTGDVRCYLEATGGGEILIHTFEHAGDDLAVPYMSTAKLPMRWHIINASASAVGSMTASCCNVSREGGSVTPSLSTSRPIRTTFTATTTEQACMHLRLASAYIRNELFNIDAILANSGSNDVIWSIYRNAVLSTPAIGWTSQGAGFVAEYSTTTADITTPGLLMASGFLLGGTNQSPGQSKAPSTTRNIFSLLADIVGVADIATLTVQTTTGTSALFRALSWAEQR